jgi:hypothetical protein
MHVGIIGGLERAEPDYLRLAREAGHAVSFHSGHVAAGTRSLHQLIDRCEVVVVLTDVNSHAAVRAARKRLRQQGRSPLLLRRLGPSRFVELLASFTQVGMAAVAGASP